MRRSRVPKLATAFGVLLGCNGFTGIDALTIGAPIPGTDDGDPAPPANPAGPSGEVPIPAGDLPDAGDEARDATTEIPSPNCTPVVVGPRYGADITGATWENQIGARTPGDGEWAYWEGGGTLRVQNFGFSIPANATIVGIKVTIHKGRISGSVQDESISLAKGDPKAAGTWPPFAPTGPTAPMTPVVYGGEDDTWGTSWSAADINATGFRVLIRPTGPGDALVDGVGVTVTYCIIP